MKLLGRSFAQLPEGQGEVGARVLHQLQTQAPIRIKHGAAKIPEFNLQQEGDEEAVVLFFTQEAELGSEQLMDPEDEESNRSFFRRHFTPLPYERTRLPPPVNMGVAV